MTLEETEVELLNENDADHVVKTENAIREDVANLETVGVDPGKGEAVPGTEGADRETGIVRIVTEAPMVEGIDGKNYIEILQLHFYGNCILYCRGDSKDKRLVGKSRRRDKSRSRSPKDTKSKNEDGDLPFDPANLDKVRYLTLFAFASYCEFFKFMILNC